MRIGILMTNAMAQDLASRFGKYPEMFMRLIHGADPAIEFRTWEIIDGELPSEPDACDAWLITGSRFSVYDDLPWIAPLEDFIRRLHSAQKKLIAVCFGHQLVARALGGRSGKADTGWVIGVQEIEMTRPWSWLKDAPARARVIHSHQDQVLELPPGATLVGTNAVCPNAMFQLGDHIMAMQGHPEFPPEYARTLFEGRRALFAGEHYSTAVASLAAGHDAGLFAEWMVAFLRSPA